MKTILTYGTYDLFHIGHVRLLERARALGDRLVVGVSSDEFNKLKGKRSIMRYEHRAAIVAALACVDEVFPEHDWEQKADDIQRVVADVLVMGDDWAGKFDDLAGLCNVTYLPRTEGISTTELKTALNAFNAEKIQDLQQALDTVREIVEQLG
jgi:glycerol-3-phosphate cytidylyltransferase